MGFSIKQYGKLDHVVADHKVHSQGTGECLVAVMLQHRGGSADRVPNETRQAVYGSYISAAVPAIEMLRTIIERAEKLRTILERADNRPYSEVSKLITDDEYRAVKAMLNVLPKWESLDR